jgi:hypothetical protein
MMAGPQQAREFIADFIQKHGPMEKFLTAKKTVRVGSMTDEEAIWLAEQLKHWPPEEYNSSEPWRIFEKRLK